MAYWLIKSEPGVYSIDDLARDRSSGWDGVRNYQARNFMKDMKLGDRGLFYHSNADPSAVVGVVEVVRTAYADPSQFDRRSRYFDATAEKSAPRWFQVDFKFLEKLARPVELGAIKRTRALSKMALVTRGRLSVQPVVKAEWHTILRMAQA